MRQFNQTAFFKWDKILLPERNSAIKVTAKRHSFCVKLGKFTICITLLSVRGKTYKKPIKRLQGFTRK